MRAILLLLVACALAVHGIKFEFEFREPDEMTDEQRLMRDALKEAVESKNMTDYTVTAFSYMCRMEGEPSRHMTLDSHNRDAPHNEGYFTFKRDNIKVVFMKRKGEENPLDLNLEDGTLHCKAFTWAFDDAAGRRLLSAEYRTYPDVERAPTAAITNRPLGSDEVDIRRPDYNDAFDVFLGDPNVRLTQQQIHVFRTVAQCGSFSKAELNVCDSDEPVDTNDELALYICRKIHCYNAPPYDYAWCFSFLLLFAGAVLFESVWRLFFRTQ